MADGTKIEWADATWNVVNGCSVHSAGCTNCYAMKQAHRVEVRRGLTRKTNGGMVWTGEVRFNEAVLLQPLRWRRPRRIFVCAHGDLFHEAVPDDVIDRVFAVMALAPQHQFQVLTKRSARMRKYLNDQSTARCDGRGTALIDLWNQIGTPFDDRILEGPWPLPNVWLGVSVENQRAADERVPDLLATPAAVRWLSCEPLLGPVNLTSIDLPGGWREVFPLGQKFLGRDDVDDHGEPLARLDWIVAGGESGPKVRPMHPDWARSLRDQCARAGVPFLFKQWGHWAPHRPTAGGDLGGDVRAGRVQFVQPRGETLEQVAEMTAGRSTLPGGRYMAAVGKRAAGRLLDGRTHDEYPA